MKDERRPARNAAATEPLASSLSAAAARRGRAPVLVIELPLEDSGRALIRADSHEDELRLRLWLRHGNRLPTLSASLERFLDRLDEQEAA